jgi:hypothetical protein
VEKLLDAKHFSVSAISSSAYIPPIVHLLPDVLQDVFCNICSFQWLWWSVLWVYPAYSLFGCTPDLVLRHKIKRKKGPCNWSSSYPFPSEFTFRLSWTVWAKLTSALSSWRIRLLLSLLLKCRRDHLSNVPRNEFLVMMTASKSICLMALMC